MSTHVLDTAAGHPAAGIGVNLNARAASGTWASVGSSRTDPDGRCRDLPPLPTGTTAARLDFDTGPAAPVARGFFPEVAVTFTVSPGEHHHVPLLLSPYGYTVYRGS
ncbi:hydroxyisourate hydrolase [Streptomyces sp. NA04227]|uniref:hydroxyisourate hydrolase n=1 Tax=Streptomyces sp. NA04227 TaxID=2742136 RepID=UPI0020CA80AB|nr:hydroxyisourate hydrolase [Streptomyces sp. NA04227]